jgi:ABC-type transport system involved in multi-copper enzyme maturation permease subunit
MTRASWTSAWRVFDLSIGEMLWSRRTVFMALVVGLPVIVAAVVRVLDVFGITALRVNGQAMGGTSLFGLMLWLLFLRFAVPVLAVFYGTALIADEVDERTLTYLFTRPIPRGSVLLGKYLAYLACTSLVVLPGVMVTYFLLTPVTQIGSTFLSLLVDLGLLAAGLTAYGALFALVGAWFRRPLVVAPAFVFGWESVVLLLPGSLKQLTVAYYLQGLVPHAMPTDGGITALLQGLITDTPSTPVAIGALCGITVGALWLAMREVERREYVLPQ